MNWTLMEPPLDATCSPPKVAYMYPYIYVMQMRGGNHEYVLPIRLRDVELSLCSCQTEGFLLKIQFVFHGDHYLRHTSPSGGEKKNGQITSQQSPLRRIAHVTRDILTRCWFSVLWRDFSYISDVVQTHIGCNTGHKLRDLQVGPLRFSFLHVLCI